MTAPDMLESLPLIPQAPRFIMPNWAFGPPMVMGATSRRWLETCRPIVAEAVSDGICHVAPILAVYRARPKDVRKRIGRGAWRRVHHAKLATNIGRAAILLHTPLGMDDVLRIPDAALREALRMYRRFPKTFRVACGFATNRATMREAVMLCGDLDRMGGAINPAWSLNRLRREHDMAAREAAYRCRADDRVPWASKWAREVNGYSVSLLRCAADLRAEGRAMRHCVASYVDRARYGHALIFRIEGPERATASFTSRGLSEIKAACNRNVKHETRAAAIKAWSIYRGEATTAKPWRNVEHYE